MRKLLITAALAAVALGGAAACTTAPPGDGPSSSPTSAAADQSASVCADAIAYEKAQSLASVNKIQEGINDAASGNTAGVAQVQTDLTKLLGDWTTKFTDLSQKPVKAEVKASLGEWLTFLNQVPAQAQTTTLPQLQSQFNDLDTKLTTACA
jgi:hypothetical protein